MNKSIFIGSKEVGYNCPVFFIAEAGVNHNGSIEYAKQLIDIAVEAGADAVKFQTFKAENLNTQTAPKSTYHIETTGSDVKQSWFDLLKSQEITPEMHEKIISYCKMKKIIFLSTPYDIMSAKLLNSLDVPAFKIASTDTNNYPFLAEVAELKKPMIISTAMCNFEEVKTAVKTIKDKGLEDLIVCQCTGNYPSKIEDSNLNVIYQYKKELDSLIGFSDHTLEFINPIAAVGAGVCMYEKHFTIDKNMDGPDHRMSLNPEELKETIRLLRLTELAMGMKEKKVLKDEIENRDKLRKSIVTKIKIKANQVITKEMITTKRPGYGIKPGDMNLVIGKKSKVDIDEDSLLDFDQLDH